MECLAKCVRVSVGLVPFAVACAILCASSLPFSAANRYSWMLDMTACRGRELQRLYQKGGSSVCKGHGRICLMPSVPIDNVRANFPRGLLCGVSCSYFKTSVAIEKRLWPNRPTLSQPIASSPRMWSARGKIMIGRAENMLDNPVR